MAKRMVGRKMKITEESFNAIITTDAHKSNDINLPPFSSMENHQMSHAPISRQHHKKTDSKFFFAYDVGAIFDTSPLSLSRRMCRVISKQLLNLATIALKMQLRLQYYMFFEPQEYECGPLTDLEVIACSR